MTAVVGISSSSQADLDRALAALGTNMLTVTPGQTMMGKSATLPDTSVSMIRRIGPVLSATATGAVDDAHAYRTDKIPAGQTGGGRPARGRAQRRPRRAGAARGAAVARRRAGSAQAPGGGAGRRAGEDRGDGGVWGGGGGPGRGAEAGGGAGKGESRPLPPLPRS